MQDKHHDNEMFQVRELNMYKVGDSLPLNCSSDTLTTDKCWREVMLNSQYREKLNEIQKFNRYRYKCMIV